MSRGKRDEHASHGWPKVTTILRNLCPLTPRCCRVKAEIGPFACNDEQDSCIRIPQDIRRKGFSTRRFWKLRYSTRSRRNENRSFCVHWRACIGIPLNTKKKKKKKIPDLFLDSVDFQARNSDNFSQVSRIFHEFIFWRVPAWPLVSRASRRRLTRCTSYELLIWEPYFGLLVCLQARALPRAWNGSTADSLLRAPCGKSRLTRWTTAHRDFSELIESRSLSVSTEHVSFAETGKNAEKAPS